MKEHLTVDSVMTADGDEAALACPSSEEPTHAYNVVSGMCDACADRCGGTLCQSMALHNICNRIHSLLAGDGE